MQDTLTSLTFGEAGQVDGSLTARARGLIGSEILKIAADVRKRLGPRSDTLGRGLAH